MDNPRLNLQFSHNEQVATLILNSPQNLNAMDLEMARAFREATSVIKEREGLRLVVIRGEGRAFSAGGDLEMLRAKADKTVQQNEQDMLWFYDSFLGLRELNLPLVCALHGHVVGAGFCFASACDIRLGDESTLLAAPFTRLALHPGMGGSYFLPRAFGTETARELMLTGRRMTAAEALQRGFLCRVTPVGTLLNALDELLAKLLKSAPFATTRLIGTERQSESESVREALRREALEQARCYAETEFLQGVEALQNKTSPPWCS